MLRKWACQHWLARQRPSKPYPNVIGNLAVSFDKKKIIHLYRDYPWQLTNEQKMQFDKENPFWADYFKDRNVPALLTGKIQKIKIHSNSICFGPEPRPDDEVEQYFSNDYAEEYNTTDVGTWTMDIKNDSGEEFYFNGSFCESVEKVDLSNLVRDELDMPNLYVFDGNYNGDE